MKRYYVSRRDPAPGYVRCPVYVQPHPDMGARLFVEADQPRCNKGAADTCGACARPQLALPGLDR